VPRRSGGRVLWVTVPTSSALCTAVIMCNARRDGEFGAVQRGSGHIRGRPTRCRMHTIPYQISSPRHSGGLRCCTVAAGELVGIRGRARVKKQRKRSAREE